MRGAIEAEAKLRRGQCADALMALRAALHVQAHLIYWRNINSVGQRGATRSATLLLRVKERIDRAATKYREAWAALRALKGEAFAPEFCKLEAADVNGRTEVENDIASMKKLREAESSRASRNEPTQAGVNAKISWIWKVAGGTDASELHDCKFVCNPHRVLV